MTGDVGKASLEMHQRLRGKIEIALRCSVDTDEALTLAYTPGVASSCLAIERDPSLSYELTRRWNTVAVVTDGTAVLGLGDIGPEAGMPVMEGKCVLFKSFGGVDAVPLCLRTRDVDEICRTVELIAGSFGGINLEDISAPRCFEVERRLKQTLDIPVFHDDQHGTAVVTLAALTNACRLTGRPLDDIRVVISGAGAAGTAIAHLLGVRGVRDVVVCDRKGAIAAGREGLTPAKQLLADTTNPKRRSGSLAEVMRGSDVFIGVSAPGIVSGEMVASMAPGAIVFSCANPNPEIMPEESQAAGAAVVASGRSDYPNQVNNVLSFPGIFRGALDVRAKDITEHMLLAASDAIASVALLDGLSVDAILPKPGDVRVREKVSAAVARAAVEDGVNRIELA